MARAAERLGAGWAILQPPPVAGLPETEYVRFLGAVADKVYRAGRDPERAWISRREPLERRPPRAGAASTRT